MNLYSHRVDDVNFSGVLHHVETNDTSDSGPPDCQESSCSDTTLSRLARHSGKLLLVQYMSRSLIDH